MLRSVKKEIRIIGFDDGPFIPRKKAKVPVIGVIYRGGNYLDGILKTEIEVDGLDATQKLIKAINSSRHKKQLRIIMLDGITIGGFNIVDISKLYEKTNLPVIVIIRKKPDLKEIEDALKRLDNLKKRIKCIKNAGEIKCFRIEKNKKIYYQSIGLKTQDVKKILKISCIHGLIPEPIRVAHLIAGAIVKGESKGRA